MNVLKNALQLVEEEGKAEVSKQVVHQQGGVPKNLAKDIVIEEVPEERQPLEEDPVEGSEDDEDEIEWIE